jgi:hypothetical protein
MGLPKYVLVVSVTVDPSVEEEWNDWYNRVHLPEIASCPGFHSSARYVCEQPERSYLTMYEIEGPSALETVEFQQRRGWSKFRDKVKPIVRSFHQIAAFPSKVQS